MLFSRGNIANTVTTTRFRDYGKLNIDDVDRNDWRMSARRESLWSIIGGVSLIVKRVSGG